MIIICYYLAVLGSIKWEVFVNSFLRVGYSNYLLIIVTLVVSIVLCSMRFYYYDYGSSLLYSSLISVSLLVMCLNFCCERPVWFLVLFECSMAPVLLLILRVSYGQDKVISSIFIICINLIGSIPAFMATFFLTSLSGVGWFTSASESVFLSPSQEILVSLSIIILFLVKMPVMFFHFWLPKAHVRSSSLCSVILASLMLKIAGMGMSKFDSILAFSPRIVEGSLRLGTFSILIAIVLMIRFWDVKIIVAISSILHMALVPFCSLLGTAVSIYGSLLVLSSHGLISTMIFFIAGIFYENNHTRSDDSIKSSERVRKIFSWVLVTGMFVNIGLPPFMNFFSELYLLTAVIMTSLFSLVIFGAGFIVRFLITMLFSLKVLSGKKNYLSQNIPSLYSVNVSILLVLVALILKSLI